MADINHKERAHAKLSASGASRWATCPGSVQMEDGIPDKESIYAQEGTLAHEMSELKLKHYLDPKGFGKRKLNTAIKKLKENELYQAEMESYTDTYVDFIKEKALSFPSNPYIEIEKRVDFSRWVDGGFGTCDCVLIHGSTLSIIDLKYGKGVPVSSEQNEQLILYALGAYDAFNLIYNLDKIELNIVQPRINNFSTWEISLTELLLWGDYFKVQAEKALGGNGELVPSAKACKFCKARDICTARAENNLSLESEIKLKPNEIPKDKLYEYISRGEDIAKWVADLKAYALDMCLKGEDVKGLKAVAGRTSRSWTNQDEAINKLIEGGIDEAIIYDKVPLTLAKLEKALGKQQFTTLVGDMVVTSEGKPTLVFENDKRPAITNTVNATSIFKPLN
ncbi:DUF2800 domain-containing protein [Gemella sanguinis]|jgi:hypothetical protein|uniref:DUF2800 domain-containing protein n=1 Tax=Gemella sanguinis TaxID=84135 RepID=UPI00352E1EF0